MRELFESWIKETAVACGLPAECVMDKPESPSALDPDKRMELAFLAESYDHTPRRLAKWTVNGGTHRRVRSVVYTARLPIRAEVFSDDEAWLATFVRNFIVTMPLKRADAENNLVKVRVEKATRGGFKRKMVDVFIKRSNCLHITFEWMLCKDTDLPLIRKVQFNPKIKEA